MNETKDLIKINTKLFDELLLDVLFEACAIRQLASSLINPNAGMIDNMCISAYEEACDYLASKGYLKTVDGRLYKIIKVKE